jgi:hypothetical protein
MKAAPAYLSVSRSQVDDHKRLRVTMRPLAIDSGNTPIDLWCQAWTCTGMNLEVHEGGIISWVSLKVGLI